MKNVKEMLDEVYRELMKRGFKIEMTVKVVKEYHDGPECSIEVLDYRNPTEARLRYLSSEGWITEYHFDPYSGKWVDP